MTASRILVIKLGALGDLIQALGPMAAIRRHHPDAHITALTTAPFRDFLEACPYVDAVAVDTRPRLLDIGSWMGLRAWLRESRFARIYDLQTSYRSTFYFKLMGPGVRPEWSGIHRDCSHPHANPERNLMHTVERQREQLAIAGIDDVPFPSLDWVEADLAPFDLPARYALIVPGGAAHRPEKRWPPERYVHAARWLGQQGMTPLIVGGPEDRDTAELMAEHCDGRSLAGETTLTELAALARGAEFALGNDTGPMHVAAVAGAPSVVLYSQFSDPGLCAQRGRKVEILRVPFLQELTVDEVTRTCYLTLA